MNFEWAMKQLQRQQRVRRKIWADVTIITDTMPPLNRRRVWHLFMQSLDFIGEDFWKGGIINGWGGSIGCAEDGAIIRDGMTYSPTNDDRTANDWELVE
jgi:hypothetical protein